MGRPKGSKNRPKLEAKAAVQIEFEKWKRDSFTYRAKAKSLKSFGMSQPYIDNFLYVVFLDGFHAHRVMTNSPK